jgi:hypothetical protein
MRSVFASSDTARPAGPSQLLSSMMAVLDVAAFTEVVDLITLVAKITSRTGANLPALRVVRVARVQ